MRRGGWFVAAGGLVAVAVAVWLADSALLLDRGHARPTPVVAARPGGAAIANGAPGPSALPIDAGTRAAPIAVADTPAALAPATSTLTEPTTPAGELAVLEGRVVGRALGDPRPRCSLTIDSGRADTDANGRFRMEVPAAWLEDGTPRRVIVRSPAGGEVFDAPLVLQQGLEIEVSQTALLRGHLVNGLGDVVRAEGVALLSPSEDGAQPARLLGATTELGTRAEFELEVPAPEPPPSHVLVRVGILSTSLDVAVPWSLLSAPEGATVLVDACTVDLRIVDADSDEPVLGCELRVAARNPGEREASTMSFLDASAAGGSPGHFRAALWRAVTNVEVAVAAPGYAARVEWREALACNETWRVPLKRLGPDDVLKGRVLDDTGQPVAGAFASCNPPARTADVSVPATRGVRTGSDGRFELPCARGELVAVRAYHRDHGMSDEIEALGGQTDLVLRFAAVRRASVVVEGALEAPVALVWVLEFENGQRASGVEQTLSFEIEEVPVGRHRLLVGAAAGSLVGSAALDVWPEAPPLAHVALGPARRLRGVVEGPNGIRARGVRVALVDSRWPAELCAQQVAPVTTGDGTFELYGGNLERARLSLTRDGQPLLEVEVPCGIETVLKVP